MVEVYLWMFNACHSSFSFHYNNFIHFLSSLHTHNFSFSLVLPLILILLLSHSSPSLFIFASELFLLRNSWKRSMRAPNTSSILTCRTQLSIWFPILFHHSFNGIAFFYLKLTLSLCNSIIDELCIILAIYLFSFIIQIVVKIYVSNTAVYIQFSLQLYSRSHVPTTVG